MRKNYLFTKLTSYTYNKVSLIFALFAIILFSNSSYSQTCNLNAGNSKTICVTDGLFLTSSSFGIAPGDTDPKVVNPRWTQVSGPSVILQTPNSASTIVDGLVGGEVYEFKLTGECFDGSGDNSQNVTITVNENTLAEAGDNISGCPGVYSLSANAPNTAIGEVGVWTINGNDNAGVTIADVNSPTTTITLSDTEVGDTTLRWSITNPSQTKTCPTDDLVVITNLGGDPVVDAGPDLEAFTNVPECYTNFQSVTMSASVGGLGNGQQGTWSFVSGPALPNIVDLNNPNTVVSQLTEGSYTLRWTVNGPCATGTDTVTINVPAATQQNTSSYAGPDQVYCTPVTSTVLEGNLPLYAGETGLWTQIDSNPAVTFSDNTSNTTTVSGMSGTADYRFRWTITAPNLGNPLYECDSSDDVRVLFRNDPTTIDVNGATNTIILPTTPENPIPSSPYNSVDLPYVFSGGTSTTAALVSGPGTVVPVYTYSSGNINVSGLDDIGTYVIRITRFASGEGLTGCGSASEDITIIVSEAPGANQDMAANAGTDSVLPCGDASTNLAGNDPTATKPGVTNVYTGYWTQIDGPDVAVFTDETLYNTLVTMTTSGVYNFRWHIVSGPPGSTPSTDDTQVTVSITPNSQIIPPPSTSNLCAGDFILEATPLAENEVGEWVQVDANPAVVFSDKNNIRTSVNLAPNTIYTIEWQVATTAAIPCTYATSVTLDVDSDVAPSAAFAGDDFCLPSGTTSVTLNADASSFNDTNQTIGEWTIVSKPNGAPDPTTTYGIKTPGQGATPDYYYSQTDADPNATYTGLQAGQYVFEWKTTNPSACTTEFTDTVSITVDPGVIYDAGTITDVCATSQPISVTMNADDPVVHGFTGTWILKQGDNSWSVDDINSPTATFSNLKPGYSYEFEWNVDKGLCTYDNPDSVSFDVYLQAEDAALTGASSDTTCGTSYVSSQVDNSTTVYGGLGSQAVATPGNGGTGIWSIVSGPNNPTINATNPDLTVSGMSTGVYVFRWTISSDNPFCPPSVPSVDFTLTVNEPADAGADIDLCDATSVILQGNETLSNNGTWTFLSSTGSDSPNPVSIGNGLATVDIIPGNTYQFTYTTPGVACGDTDTVTVTNSAPPETPNAGTDQEVCLGDTNIATMNATALTSPSEGEWSVISEPAPGAANILAVNNPTTNIELSTTVEGLYIFQFKSTNPGSNCTNGISDFIRVNSYLEPSDAVITPIPDNSCQFSTVLEAATPINGLGTWELIDSNSLDGSGNPYNIAAYDPPASYTPGDISIDSPNNPTTALSIVNEYTLALGDYTFRWKVANGSCATKEDIITITYNGVPPTDPDAGPNQFLCASSSVIMNGNNITVGTGEWSQVGTTPSIVTFDNKFNEDTGVTGLTSAGVYTFMWTSSNGGCSFSDTMEVTITDDVAAANAGPDQNLSQFDAVVLAANDPLPGEGVWTFVSGPNTPNILDINDPATNVAGTVPGTYEFTWTVDNNPCVRTTDNVIITILPSVDLDLEKTLVTPLPISVGDVLDFQIEVTNNNANFDGTGVSVLDELPIGYSIVTGSVSNGGIYNSGGRSINWDGLTISKGSSVILTYKVTVEASGPYINTAQITSLDQSDPDSTPNNNVLSEDDQSSVTTTPGPVVDIALVKTVNNAAPNVGSNVIFTITVNNNGPSNATGIAVSDVLPSGYTYVSSNSATGGASIDDSTPASGTGIVWTVGNLASGASETLDITATVNASGSYNNTASISATNETDSDTSNNQDSEATVPVSVADLNLTKTVSAPANGSSYLVGEKVKFTITVNNAGPSIATGVNVVEYLPTGYSYDADNGSGAYTPATGSWVIGTISAGGSSVLEIDAIINDSGNYNNVAEVVHSDQQDPDSTPGNNTITEDDQAQVDITPTKVANLSLVKTVDESTPIVGDNVKFTLALTNAGPSDATSVVVNDQLPVGYTFVSYTATSGAYDSVTGNWTLSGSVLNGKTEYLDIVATVNAATGAANEYKNDAEVTATDQFDPNSTENNGVVTEDDYSTTSTTPTPLIDLSLTKSVDNVQAVAGTDVVFTVIVSNDGPSNATGVVVTDQLPSGYTLVSHTGGASYVPATGVWTIGNLANGTTATLNVTATVLATGNYTNVAEITSATETDVDSAPNNDDLTEDDQDEVTVSRDPLVNLSLTKGVDVPSPNVGSNVKFTITVTNVGPSNATGVVVSDELPSGYSFVGATPSVGSYDSVSGSWTIGNLGITNATLEIEATVLPTGDYDNVAEITGTTEVDENSTPGNNDILEDDQEKVVVTPVERADLSVSKVVDISSPNVGDNVTFTIDVSNAGPSDATNVVITDQLPTGYQFVSASPTAGMYNSTTGLWTVSRPIIAGTTETIQIVATVLESGVYKNDAEVTSSDQADPDSTVNDGTGDDFSTVTPSPSPLVDLALMKRIDNATPDVGSDVVFTIEIVNNGPSNATGVVSNDLLPSGYSWVSDDSTGDYVPATGVWSIGNLAINAKATLNITATVLATGDYTNTATVTSAETDDDTTNNTNSISSTPRPIADLVVTKAVVNASPNVGENVVFNLTVKNEGPSDATGVVVTDKLPSGYAFVSSTETVTTTYNDVSGAWNVGSLANGVTANLSITAKVLGTGDYDNVAQVTGSDQHDLDSTPNNNNPSEDDYSEVPVTPINSANLVTTKEVDNPTPNEGDTIIYKIVVTNNGGTTAATGVNLTDNLPAGVTYVSDDSSGAYNSGSGIWTIGDLAVNASVTLNIIATVNANTSGNTIINTTSRASGDQVDPTNVGDDLTETIIVNKPPVATNDSVSGVVTGTPAVLTDISGNDTLSDGSAVDTTPGGNATISLDPTDSDGDGNPLTLDVPGEGVWTYDPATDDLTFDPDLGFTADPTPIDYTLTETGTGLTDTATVTVGYVAQAPVAVLDSDLDNTPNTAVTLNVTSNDADSDAAAGGVIDPMTVSLITPAGATSEVIDANGDVTSFAVPGEGTWSVNEATGSITFTPLAGFTNDPTVVSYNVEDNDGNQSNNVTVTVDYVPVAVNDESLGNTVASDVTLNVLGNDTEGDAVVANTFVFGSTANPLPAGAVVSGTPGASDYQLTVAGEGVWSYDGSGSLTFDPEAGFTTDPTVIGYTVSDAEGNATSATATVTYGELPPVANDNTDVTLNTTTQPSAPLQILTDDLLSDGVTPASPTNTTLDLDPSTAGVQDVLVVAGEGTWNYNSANGEIVFTPETILGGFASNFTADPTPIVYTLTENQTGLTDTATVTIDYQEVAPIANDDISSSNPAGAVTLDPLTGAGADTDSDGVIDPTRVSLVVPSGATTNVVDGNNDVTSVTVPGEGTWNVDEVTGSITFTPLTGFTDDPTPIDYNIADNDGNVSATPATVTVDYVPVAVNDESLGNTVASDVTLNVLGNDTEGDAVVANTFVFGSTANPLSAGAVVSGTPGASDYQLTVAGEGVWSYDGSGSLTFDPEAGFTTDPTVIGYTVSDAEGNATSAIVTVTYGELPPVANDNTDVTLNTTTQPSAPLQILTDDLLSDGVTPASPTNTTLDLDPSTAGVQDVLVVAGEGTWNYNLANGEIVFTPETISGGFASNFTADPTPIVYTLTENQTGLTDTATVTIDYQEVAPIANDDISSSNPAGAVTLDPLTGAGADTDSDGVIDPTRVSLVVPSGATTNVVDGNNDVTSVTVPGEGTWNVDEVTGSITFTPLTGFTDDPTPIDYNIADNDGNVSATPATVTVDYVPVAVNDESLGNTVASDVTLNVLGNDTEGDAVVANTFVFGSTANPLSAGAVVSGTPGASDYQLTVAGEGVWSYDGSGSLTFDPEAGFTTDPTVIGYTVSDAEGNATSAIVTVTYGELPPVANDNTDVTLNTTTQPSAPLQILTDDLLSDGVTPASPTNTTLDLDPSTAGVQDVLVVAGEGTWNYNLANGEIVFTPETILGGFASNFTADPTPIVYTLTENQTGLTDTATVTIDYQEVAPTANDDSSLSNTVGAVTLDPLTGAGADTDSDGVIDPTRVSLVVPAGATTDDIDGNNDVTSVTVPGEGTWNVDEVTGSITFTPLTGFTDDPTPIDYNIADNDGNVSATPATVTVDYVPVAVNDESLGNTVASDVTLNVLGNDTEGDAVVANTFVFGSTANPLSAGAVVSGTPGASDYQLTVAGEGVWSYDGSGSLTFDPEAGFTTDPTVIGYTVSDAEGNATSAIVTVTYGELPPVANDNTDVTLNTTTQPSAPLQILTDDLLSDGVTPASPTNTTLDLDPSTAGVQDVLVVAGEGTWNYNLANGEIVFTPETISGGFASNFTADPTPIVYTLTENQTGLTDTATVTIDYQEVAPIANDDSSLSNTVGAVTLDPLTGAGADTDSDGVIDPTRVSLVVPAGATTDDIDGNNDVTSVTVPGEGTWNVDEVTGSITFTPLTGFTDDPTPIDYNIADNDGNVSATPATVTVDYVPVAVNDESLGNTVASDVTLNVLGNDTEGDAVVANTFVFGSTANPLSAGAVVSGTPGASDYQLTVAGEGVWSYDGSGSLTFDPEAGFTTDPTVIGYTVSDAEGNATSAIVTVTYGELPPVANDNTDVTLNTTTQPSAPLQILTDDLLSDGVTPASPTNTTLDLDPSTAGVQDVLVVAGEGTWNYNLANGEIVFTPETISGGFASNFTADPTPIVYTLTENQTGLTDTATVTIDYQEVAPIANDDISSSNPAGAVTLDPLTGAGADTDSDGVIDPTRVSLVVPSGATTNVVDGNNDVTSVTVPGEGTWNVDEVTGSITFTPLTGFTDDPTPIDYNIADNDGNVSATPATVTVDYVPVAVNDESLGNTVASDVTLNVLGNDTEGDAVVANTFVFGSTANPLSAGAVVSGTPGASDYQLTVAGEGVWSYDGSGSLTFDPEAGFTTDPTVIGYTVSDAEGNATSAIVTVTYGELPPVANDNTDVTLNTTTQPSAPLQILTDDLLSDGVTPASPTNTTLDLDPSTAGVQDVLVVAGEGTWNYNLANGEIVFTPETISGGFASNFTADPTPIVYTLTENQTGLTDTATVTIDYQEVAPIANDDISSSNPAGAVTLDPLTGAGADTDSDGVIDPTRVSLVVPSGATTNVVDGNNDVTSVTVPGEGTWNVDEVTGSITFTPLTGFTDDPTPIDYNIADNDGNVSATPATVTVDYVPVAVNDESLGNTVASDVTLNVLGNDTEGDAVVANTFVFGSTANPLPAGAVVSGTPGASDYQLTVAGEGVWSYDGSGSLTFDPEAGFTTDPTVIGYTVSDAEGNATSAIVTVTYNEVSPVATDDSVNGIVTGVDAVLSDISVNDTLSDGSPVDTNPSTGNATISIDPNDTDGDGNPLTLDVPGEGVWSYDPTTDDLTFNPDPTFTADPTPIVYTLTETITGESTTAIASAGYVAQAPVATSDTDLNNVPGNLVTVDVTSNDADSDASGSIDPTTVSLIVPVGTATNVNKDANGDVISFVIPGEGTWFVDAISGSITFTPEVGYTQDPTPIAYTVDDNDGNISNQATVTIGYSPLNIIATNDDFTNSPVNGIEGESLVGNILTSDTGDGFDTLNGDAATRNNVIISIVNPATPIVAGALVPVIDVVTGNITVPAGTPADTYTITYSICDKLEPNPPGNCDTAVVTVVVEAAPIVAEDDVIAGGNGLNGNSNVGNLFDDNTDGNDTLNGVSTDVSDVAISIIAPATPKLPGAPVPSVDVSTGVISIPPGTPAGDYEINYSICEILNPSNCDTATITVTVDPAKIDAINDDFSAIPINGLDGANTASVLLNDTLNGVIVSPADVNLTAGVAPTTTSGGLTMNADGTITVAPNTPAGTYVYPYTICEVLNPTNCDTAEATVVVEEAVIDAIVDDYSLSPVNGLDGEPNVGNALDNDTLNGIPVVLADVTITIKTPATPIAGAPVPVIDPATGIVSVPVGTPGGTYTIEYTICENLNPNNCDTTTVIVVVDSPEIVAVDNIPVTPVNGFEGKVAVVNVFDNDTLNGILVNPDEVTLKLITADPNNALTLNGDGTVDVAPGTAAGTYELEYQICEVLNPTNCDIAKVIVVVEEAIIVAENDDFSSKPVNSLDGSANVGNVLANNGDGADTLNGSSVDIDAVNLTVVSPATPLTPGATVPVIDPSTGIVSVPSGTPAGTYKIGYSICEELNPTNCDDAIVTVVVGTGPIVANDDIIGNVDGYNGDDNVGNVLTDNGSGSDTLNGVPVLIDEVVISIVTPATPLVSGAPVPTIDPSTGIISVPSGTPGGSYEIEYQICEVLNPVNCTTAIVTVDVKESADLTLLKEVDVDTPNVGDTVNFTITLTNNGLNNATGVNVVDQLPTGYTFVSAVASVGTYSEVSGSWNVGAVTASENETLVITAMVNATGNYSNTAEVTSSDQEDPTSTPGNSNPTEDDYDDATTTPIKITDLVTTKVVSRSVANVGDIVEFTLNVVNNGPSNATGVSLIENLPSGLTYISHTATGGTVNSFTSGIWSIGNLPLGGSATITIRASVNKGEAGNNINNVVTAASGNEVDLTTVGDDLEESIYVTSADLAVTKIVDDATPNVGNTISYVIEVINNGPDTATNVSLVDNLPVGVTFVSSSTTNGTFNNGSGEWSIGDLASGASANLTIEATVNEGTIGKTITNTTSSVVSDQEDPDTTNNIGAVSIVPVGVIDLRLTKTIVNNITTPLVGDKLTFEIRVYNDGPTDATGVQVSELVPSGYKYENYSSTIGTYNPTTGLWNIGKVEVGNTAVLLVDVTVLESGVYENCAEIITANEDDKDSTPANGVAAEDDYDCASVTPVTELDLSIVKTVVNGNTSPKVGEVITFEIQLTNNGPINGTDVTVIDNLLPLSYTFVNYSSTVGAYDENTGIWNVGKIAANDIEILLIDVIVEAEGTTASYTNCATVNSVHQPDVNATNDTSCITLTPVQTVDLELTKDVSENKPVAGSNVDFTVNLTNNGLSTANGVEVLDLLPSGYTFVSATTTAGSYNELTGLWTVDTVLKDETQTLTVTATVEAFGDWLNIAEVTAINELDIDSTPNNGDLYEDDMAQRATEPEVLLAIPEGFTPDGDGKNDVFEIKHLEVLYPKFGMEIVNRYGNVVYTYKHDGNPSTSPKWWNGFSTGRWNLSSDSLPAGTYYYTIYFNNDDRKPQTGWLYLRK